MPPDGAVDSSCSVAQVNIAEAISNLFDAERQVRRLHDELAERVEEERVALLVEMRAAVTAAAALEDEEEAALRLVCAARLLGELDGASVVDALIDVLDVDSAEARSEAGEQLQAMAFERFKEVALGIERALSRFPKGSYALVELPYILVEIPEGGVIKLLGQFLKHPDPDAVGAAIEALVEVGDPAAIKLLEPMRQDTRVSRIGDDDQLQAEVAIGTLVQEAVEYLETAELAE